MSNKVVSQTYRNIIDDVISNVRQDFEDMGIEKEVLEELQRSWEAKIVATQVAEFEGAPALPPPRSRQQPKAGVKSDGRVDVKNETSDGLDSDSDVKQPNKAARIDASDDATAARSHRGGQQNGESSTAPSGSEGKERGSAEDDIGTGSKRKRISNDDEIGSDLDDSDEDDGEGGIEGDINEDMVLCLYDKVQRVKNKWKCVLKDGVASIDGRDYLFTKCNG
ncbi:TFIIA-domain-containing protein [Violaceomyces palustris]|uniref:TFIIA-domain-containing protein n=1 Tax=Violaceomyces palustris TaxID=1673888 RepID=A0ACD0P6I7_9BASI|nr:TFIIA-domain-containing protein [Violaceomyces palustris]